MNYINYITTYYATDNILRYRQFLQYRNSSCTFLEVSLQNTFKRYFQAVRVVRKCFCWISIFSKVVRLFLHECTQRYFLETFPHSWTSYKLFKRNDNIFTHNMSISPGFARPSTKGKCRHLIFTIRINYTLPSERGII